MLGNLVKVEARNVWPNEATNFTPWLASSENINRLGVAIGLELEVEHTEVAVGPFSADIVAFESVTGNYVVIENQLTKTDHDHLGKSLTYAASLGAKTVVWVATEFTDEHRKTLDWLNANCVNEISFFGVQLELWTIDESKPAVRFNVVSRPPDWRPKKVPVDQDLTPIKQLQLEWWTVFRDALMAAKAVPSARSPSARLWYDISLGRTGYHLSATANLQGCEICVRVYLKQKFGADEALEQLLDDREEIEQALGEPLIWNPNPDNNDKVILLRRAADLRIKELWPDHLKWMVDAVVRLRKEFGPRIKALQIGPINGGQSPPE